LAELHRAAIQSTPNEHSGSASCMHGKVFREGVVYMCDYSLMEFQNRLAVEGEVLEVHRFRSGSLGLASPADCSRSQAKPEQTRSIWGALKEMFSAPPVTSVCAVCIPPGARLMLHEVPARLQKTQQLSSEEMVTFVQTSAEVNTYRDAIRFRNGYTMRLQELTEGQRLQVLDLGFCAAEPRVGHTQEGVTARR
jgi:hypothetical protein